LPHTDEQEQGSEGEFDPPGGVAGFGVVGLEAGNEDDDRRDER